jgi:FolB domain-containing protein
MLTDYPATLSLHQLALSVHLGYGEKERATPQTVFVDMTFYLNTLPKACFHDGEGFFCYDRLSRRLGHAVEGVHFRLIEYLARALADVADQWIADEAERAEVEQVTYMLRVHKPNLPIPALQGGASFTISTLPAAARP